MERIILPFKHSEIKIIIFLADRDGMKIISSISLIELKNYYKSIPHTEGFTKYDRLLQTQCFSKQIFVLQTTHFVSFKTNIAVFSAFFTAVKTKQITLQFYFFLPLGLFHFYMLRIYLNITNYIKKIKKHLFKSF